MVSVIVAIVSLVLGGFVVFAVKRYQDNVQKTSAQIEADKIIAKAKSEAARIDRDSRAKAKDFEVRARKNVEADILKQKSKLKSTEGQLERRLKEIEQDHKERMEENEKQTQSIKDRDQRSRDAEQRLKDTEKKLEAQIQEASVKLSQVANLTKDEALRELMKNLEEDAKRSASKRLSEIELETQKEADVRAKRVIAVALSRFAGEYTSERTVSVMSLPSDEMKGKIIGREGRNIRALEAACGVDLIVDDTPEAVVISGFDPVRRELARRTIEKLIEDGRVHPARIEEVVEKVRADLNKSVKEEGEKAALEAGVTGLHPEILKVLGSLKYRHSHTQNSLNHALEVAQLSGLMAAELGVSVSTAKRAGLLHDIGKALDHTVEGSHSVAGAEFVRKFGEADVISQVIRSHHDEEKPISAIGFIVSSANIISESRPGARRPGMDNFINRLQEIESIGNSFDGVVRTFALQAGREVRVLVEASRVTDDQLGLLGRDVGAKIERELPQMGSTRITVLRETRSVELAK